MQTLITSGIALDDIESEAEFVLFSKRHGLISEHYTVCEAQSAYFQEAGRFGLGDYLPTIYQREDTQWVPFN